MIPYNTIEKILEAGVQAPSGENAQPWLFKIEGNSILLFNNPDSDKSLYNYKQSGSFVAHGTCIENIIIAAGDSGYSTEIAYFPDSKTENFVATINLQPSESNSHLLGNAVGSRATNRKLYDGSALTTAEKNQLLDIPHLRDFPARIVLIEDRGKIAVLAKAASLNEQMLVDNEHVRHFFFNHVRWDDEENQKDPKGFYIKTLELQPPQIAAFKMLRRSWFARFFSALGGSRIVGKDNEKIYNSSSAMIGIITKANSPYDLVMSGRILEYIWLTATRLALSIQPTTGALFLAEGAQTGNRDSFSPSQREALDSSRKSIYKTLDVHEGKEYVALLLRIGHGGEPSARSARFPIKHFLI